MAAGELQNYIRSQIHGESADSGTFTVNTDRALGQVAGFVKLYPDWHIVKFVQALVLAGALEMRCGISRTSYVFEAELPSDSSLLKPDQIATALRRAEFDESDLGHLISSLAGCAALEPRRLVLSTPQGGLLHGSEWKVLEQLTSPKLRWEFQPNWSWWESIRKRTLLSQSIADRCRYLPMPFYLDSKEHLKDWNFLTSLVAEQYRGVGSIGFEGPDLEGYVSLGDDLYIYNNGCPDRRMAFLPPACTVVRQNTSRANFRQVLSLNNFATSKHHLVRHGVIVESLELGKSLGTFSQMNLGVTALTDCSHLKTDASGRRFVDSEEYRKMQRDLLIRARELCLKYLQNLDLERTFALRRAVSSNPRAVWLGRALARTKYSAFSREHNASRLECLEKLLKDEEGAEVG